MQADFLNAHERHWNDAERLMLAQRWANADHLYGIAAECGLKALMERLSSEGVLSKLDYVHVMEDKKANNAWSRYQSYLSGHALATKISLPVTNPFSDWLVSQRYVHQSNFDQQRAEEHQAAAKTVCDLIAHAQREGLL